MVQLTASELELLRQSHRLLFWRKTLVVFNKNKLEGFLITWKHECFIYATSNPTGDSHVKVTQEIIGLFQIGVSILSFDTASCVYMTTKMTTVFPVFRIKL